MQAINKKPMSWAEKHIQPKRRLQILAAATGHTAQQLLSREWVPHMQSVNVDE